MRQPIFTFIHHKKLENTKEQGKASAVDWCQAEKMLSDMETGNRRLRMTRLHGNQEGLYEVRTNRKHRLIFQKTIFNEQDAFILVVFMLDHRHGTLKVPNKRDFSGYDLNKLGKEGYALFNNKGSVSIVDTAEAHAAVSQRNSAFFNGHFIELDEKQDDPLIRIFKKGLLVITGPAGGGKSLRAAALVQDFYEQSLLLDDAEVESQKKQILYITQSVDLVDREAKNFSDWDPDFSEHASQHVEFLPYDFFAYRVINKKPDARFKILDDVTNKSIINLDYLAWKNNQLDGKAELIAFIQFFQTKIKNSLKLSKKNGAQEKNTPQEEKTLLDFDAEDIYRELVLNSVVLNTIACAAPAPNESYTDLGDRQSKISRQHKKVREQIIGLYSDYLNKSAGKYHLPFYNMQLADSKADYDIIVDEGQDFSSAAINNLLLSRGESGRCVVMLDTNQTLDDRLSIRPFLLAQIQASSGMVINLSKNYRTPPRMIQFINQLIGLKNKLLGGVTEKDEYTQVDAPDTDWEQSHQRHPGRIQFSDNADQYRQLVRFESDDPNEITGTTPNFAVVAFVPEEHIPVLRKKYNTRLVFTPRQIKGLEFKYVLIHGAFEDVRCALVERAFKEKKDFLPLKLDVNRGLRDKVSPDESDIATWMNAFYVAVTRATEQLVVIKAAESQLTAHIETFYEKTALDQVVDVLAAPVVKKQSNGPGAVVTSSDTELFISTLERIASLKGNAELTMADRDKTGCSLLRPFVDKKITNAALLDFLRVDDSSSMTLDRFKMWVDAACAIQLLEKTPIKTYEDLWKIPNVFGDESVVHAIQNELEPPSKKDFCRDYIRLLKELFSDLACYPLLKKKAVLSAAEKTIITKKVRDIACKNKFKIINRVKFESEFRIAMNENNAERIASLFNVFPIELRNAKGETPLILAASMGCLVAVKVLLDNGAKIDAINGQGAAALYCVVRADNQTPSHLSVAEMLLKSGAAVNAVFVDSESHIFSRPLNQAILSCNVEMVKLLLRYNADVNKTDVKFQPNKNSSKQMLPLDYALLKDNSEIIDLLKEKGARQTSLGSVISKFYADHKAANNPSAFFSGSASDKNPTPASDAMEP